MVLCIVTFSGCAKQMTVTRARLAERGGQSVSVLPESGKSFSDGLSLYRADELDAAAEYFALAVEIDSTNWQAHYFLGLVYLKQFDGTSAIAALHAALTHAPEASRERALIYLALGELWEQQGDYSRAKLGYHTALNLDPGSSRAQAGLKRLEQLSQRIEK